MSPPAGLVQAPPGLRGNLAAMGMVQLANYLIPLLSLPYLTRVLGPEEFGRVAFALLLTTYFTVVVDYGFTWSATRKIAARRDDPLAVSRLVMATWAAQGLLVVVALVLAAGVVGWSGRLRPDAALYAAAATSLVGQALFPVWLLQGLERARVVAGIQLTSRGAALLGIFLLVRSPADAVLVLLLQGGGAILAGTMAVVWASRQAWLRRQRPSWREVAHELRDGLPLFLSRAAIALYIGLVPLWLGWVGEALALAYFTLADKLRVAVQSLTNPLSEVLFPRISHLLARDGRLAHRLLLRGLTVTLGVASAASLLLWAAADTIVRLLAGPDYSQAAELLRWLAPCPVLVALSNVFGVQVLVAHGRQRLVSVTCVGVAAASAAGAHYAITAHGAVGAAVTVLAAECVVALVYTLAGWRVLRGWKCLPTAVPETAAPA